MSPGREPNIDPEKYHLNLVIPLIVFHSITAISATLLNVFVIITIWKTPSLQTPSRILLCSLALTDLLVGVVLQPAVIFYFESVLVKWSEAYSIFLLNSILGHGLVAVSFVNCIVIALDRFLAIKTKQVYKSIVTKKRSLIVIILSWIIPGPIIAMVRHFNEGEENVTKITMVLMVVVLLTITTLYSMCFYYLRKLSSQVANTTNQPASNQPASQFNVWKYKRSLVTMVMVLGLILLSYLPLTILLSIRKTSEVYNDPGLLHLCESFLMLSSTLNPMLYLWRMKDLRQCMKNIFCFT
jgi:hypothetical protein